MCMIKDYQDIPQRSLIEDCALEHAIDFDQLSDCASQDDGAYGVDMLRSSIRRSADVCYSSFTEHEGPSTNTVISRLASRRVAQSDSTKKYTVSGTAVNGRIVQREPGSTTWLLRSRSCTGLPKRRKNLRPQLASLSERIS